MAGVNSPMELDELLKRSDATDLDVLVDYITDNGEGRLALDDRTCSQLASCRKKSRYPPKDIKKIADEIRLFGGNTFVNFFRKEGAPYEEMASDVAKHMGVAVHKGANVKAIENKILESLFKGAWKEMKGAQQAQMSQDLGLGPVDGAVALDRILTAAKRNRLLSLQLSFIIANSVAATLIGRGLPLAANLVVGRSLGIALGPIGWVVTGLWSIADLASPAYRVTVPCVIQVAYMRQKLDASSQSIA